MRTCCLIKFDLRDISSDVVFRRGKPNTKVIVPEILPIYSKRPSRSVRAANMWEKNPVVSEELRALPACSFLEVIAQQTRFKSNSGNHINRTGIPKYDCTLYNNDYKPAIHPVYICGRNQKLLFLMTELHTLTSSSRYIKLYVHICDVFVLCSLFFKICVILFV